MCRKESLHKWDPSELCRVSLGLPSVSDRIRCVANLGCRRSFMSVSPGVSTTRWNATGAQRATRLFAERRDTASLRRLTIWADSVDMAAMRLNGKVTPSATAALPAFRALASGDTTAALRRLLGVPMSACNNSPCAASTLVALQRGRPADAARVLDRWLTSASARTDLPMDWLVRARIAEQLGDAEKAAMWRGGDAELLASVNEATAGIVRVSRE